MRDSGTSLMFKTTKATHKTETSLLQQSNMSIDLRETNSSAPAERYVAPIHSTPLECGRLSVCFL